MNCSSTRGDLCWLRNEEMNGRKEWMTLMGICSPQHKERPMRKKAKRNEATTRTREGMNVLFLSRWTFQEATLRLQELLTKEAHREMVNVQTHSMGSWKVTEVLEVDDCDDCHPMLGSEVSGKACGCFMSNGARLLWDWNIFNHLLLSSLESSFSDAISRQAKMKFGVPEI